MGNEIDCYLPAEGTLTSNQSYFPDYERYDSYPGATVTSYDCGFSGTSAACPVAAGLIATAMQTNRSWQWPDVRTWIQSMTVQDASTFYQGPDPATATSTSWTDLNSLMGGTRRVAYNTIQTPQQETVTTGGTGLSIGGPGLIMSFE
jgi:hypothetical protein